MGITRRGFIIGLPLVATGCSTGSDFANYSARPEEPHPLGAMPLDRVRPELRRQEVAYSGRESAGTIVVNTPERRLYYVLGDGRAIRYGIGVGRAGLALSGDAKVGRKAEWPGWTPPATMIRREAAKGRKLPAFMPGGPDNPLGARALYIGSTIYRIHGTNQPWTIGHAMSSGCIRMANEDVKHLYEMAGVGTTVVVVR